jgi:gas vesicle protein
MSSGKVLLGVLAGVAVGATLGILFAPDKGSNTRKKIARKADDYSEELEDQFNDLVKKITRKFEDMKDEAASMAEQSKQEVEEAINKATQAIN